MPISSYTTKVDSMKTIGEIQHILVENNAEKIATDIKDKIPVAITFQVTIKNKPVFFRLEANYKGVLKAMEKDKKVPRKECTEEQAIRVTWRNILYWIEAQMAMVQAETFAIEQILLPFAVMPSGKTVYDEVNNNNLLQLGQ